MPHGSCRRWTNQNGSAARWRSASPAARARRMAGQAGHRCAPRLGWRTCFRSHSNYKPHGSGWRSQTWWCPVPSDSSTLSHRIPTTPTTPALLPLRVKCLRGLKSWWCVQAFGPATRAPRPRVSGGGGDSGRRRRRGAPGSRSQAGSSRPGGELVARTPNYSNAKVDVPISTGCQV